MRAPYMDGLDAMGIGRRRSSSEFCCCGERAVGTVLPMPNHTVPTSRRGFNLKHLKGAVTHLVGSHGGGTCFFRSAAMVLDVPGTDLWFGVLAGATEEELAANPAASPTPFIHSWVQYGETVYSPTQIEREGELIPWQRAVYYKTNGVRDAHMMARPALLKLSGEIGLSAHLRLGRPLKTDASFVFTVLDRAGLPYATARDGGLVPPEFAGC